MFCLFARICRHQFPKCDLLPLERSVPQLEIQILHFIIIFWNENIPWNMYKYCLKYVQIFLEILLEGMSTVVIRINGGIFSAMVMSGGTFAHFWRGILESYVFLIINSKERMQDECMIQALTQGLRGQKEKYFLFLIFPFVKIFG